MCGPNQELNQISNVILTKSINHRYTFGVPTQRENETALDLQSRLNEKYEWQLHLNYSISWTQCGVLTP